MTRTARDRSVEVTTTRAERAVAELANNQRTRIEALEAELKQARQLLADWRDAEPLAAIDGLVEQLEAEGRQVEATGGPHWLVHRNLPTDTCEAVQRIDRLLAGA